LATESDALREARRQNCTVRLMADGTLVPKVLRAGETIWPAGEWIVAAQPDGRLVYPDGSWRRPRS